MGDIHVYKQTDTNHCSKILHLRKAPLMARKQIQVHLQSDILLLLKADLGLTLLYNISLCLN